MRWYFVDHILSYHCWSNIATRKAISLEEYYLLAPLGREGVFPESLLIECCRESAWWLTVASSNFSLCADLVEVSSFTVTREVTAGTLLTITLDVESNYTVSPFRLRVVITGNGQPIAHGNLTCTTVPLGSRCRPPVARARWEEMYGVP